MKMGKADGVNILEPHPCIFMVTCVPSPQSMSIIRPLSRSRKGREKTPRHGHHAALFPISKYLTFPFSFVFSIQTNLLMVYDTAKCRKTQEKLPACPLLLDLKKRKSCPLQTFRHFIADYLLDASTKIHHTLHKW